MDKVIVKINNRAVSVGRDGSIVTKSGTSLKHFINIGGYPSVSIAKKVVMVHRLLAIAFIPNPKNRPVVNHIDGNKLNFSLENLEWVTHGQNTIHAVDNGLHGASKRSVEFKTFINENEFLLMKKIGRGSNSLAIKLMLGFYKKYGAGILEPEDGYFEET